MINFYKQIENGYIIGIGTHGPDNMTEITAEDYADLLSIIRSKPSDPEGYTYMLRDADLQWELVELPPEPGDDDIDDTEALAEILEVLQ